MNGNNSLADGTGKLNNACLYVNGHTTFKGTGSLTVLGNTKHGITGDEHMVIEDGTINITSLGDGLHVSEYFKQTGGNLTIKSTADGIDVGFKGVNKGSEWLRLLRWRNHQHYVYWRCNKGHQGRQHNSCVGS